MAEKYTVKRPGESRVDTEIINSRPDYSRDTLPYLQNLLARKHEDVFKEGQPGVFENHLTATRREQIKAELSLIENAIKAKLSGGTPVQEVSAPVEVAGQEVPAVFARDASDIDPEIAELLAGTKASYENVNY